MRIFLILILVAIAGSVFGSSNLIQLKSKSRASTSQFNDWNYYMSTNAAIWSDAIKDCKNQLGQTAHLLSLESDDEEAFINKLLDDNGIATTFWTSGRFDTATSGYVWDQGSKPLPPWAPWTPGHPPKNGNPLLRVIINHASFQGSKWEIATFSRTMRYICELPDLTVGIPCYQDNDLIIVLDSSGSIGPANYQIAKDWSSSLAKAFSVHSKNRLGFSIFSNFAQSIFGLSVPLSPTDPYFMDSLIRDAPYHNGGTQTDLAIDEIISDYSSGSRGLPRNVVVITDGESFYPSLTAASAQRAQEMGIRMFSVGITDYVNDDELLAIAGSADRVFKASTFQELVQILAPVSRKVCPDQ